MQSIVRHPLPVIAEVQGMATAAGCQLVASCDLAVASQTARFATPGVDIGLFCSTPMVALSRNLSNKAAMEMLLTGASISAEHALQLGLINRIASPETLTEQTMTLAATIAAKPRATVKVGKEAFYRQHEMTLAEAYDYAAKIMTENMLAAEAEEGICAFIEKRTRSHRNELSRYTDQIHPALGQDHRHGGSSANEIRPSYFAMTYLLNKGYKIIPVNPGMAGEKDPRPNVFPLKDIPARWTWSTSFAKPNSPLTLRAKQLRKKIA